MTSPPDVEITDVQVTRVDGNFTWTFVRLYTGTGVTGTGEAYWGAGVAELIEDAKPILVGEDPRDIDRLYTDLIEGLSGAGSIGGATVTAISGIEIALHDLAGKLLDVPAYQLLGGTYRDEVRVYCDTHAGRHPDEASEDDEDPYAPAAYADAAERVIDDGFDALKFDLDASTRYEGDEYNRHLGGESIEHKRSIVEAVTDRVGTDADVAFDCHWQYSGDSARRLARAIEPYDVWWLEDPVPPENHDVQRAVTQATDTTVCAGENVYRKQGTRRLIDQQAVDIVQPDMPKVGGMRETRKIADHADTYYLPMALHNVSSPLGTMAGANVAAACPNFLALEYHARDLDWWGDIVTEGPVIRSGRIELPEVPGIGVTLDADVVREHLADGWSLFDTAG
jgi:gluconate/galactonate dehydratase